MGNYLPSKTFVAVFLPLGTLFFVGVAFYLFYGGESGGLPAQEALIASARSELTSSLAKDDADSDGLLDWEETLWKTDPNTADTDKDGTKDGDEVSRNRDPLKPYPNDVIEQGVLPEASFTRFQSDTELTETDAFARNLLSSYLELKQKQGEVDERSQQRLVEGLLENASFNLNTDQYVVDNLKIIKSPTSEQVRNYKVAISSALSSIASIDGNELVILKEFITKHDTSKLSVIERAVEVYKNTASELLKIEVPEEAVTPHLTLINNSHTVSKVFSAALSYEQNPVFALVAFSSLQTIYATTGFARDDLIALYVKYGV